MASKVAGKIRELSVNIGKIAGAKVRDMVMEGSDILAKWLGN
jgi:hypothetical protein